MLNSRITATLLADIIIINTKDLVHKWISSNVTDSAFAPRYTAYLISLSLLAVGAISLDGEENPFYSYTVGAIENSIHGFFNLITSRIPTVDLSDEDLYSPNPWP